MTFQKTWSVAAGRGFVRAKDQFQVVVACENKFDSNGCRGVRRHALLRISLPKDRDRPPQ